MPTKEQVEDFKKRKAYHDSLKKGGGYRSQSVPSDTQLQEALHEFQTKYTSPKKKK